MVNGLIGSLGERYHLRKRLIWVELVEGSWASRICWRRQNHGFNNQEKENGFV